MLWTIRTSSARGARAAPHVEVSRGETEIAKAHAPGLRGGAELGVLAEEGVQAGLEVEAGVDRLQQHRAPFGVEPAPGRRHPDQQAARAVPDGLGATIGTGRRQKGTARWRSGPRAASPLPRPPRVDRSEITPWAVFAWKSPKRPSARMASRSSVMARPHPQTRMEGRRGPPLVKPQAGEGRIRYEQVTAEVDVVGKARDLGRGSDPWLGFDHATPA
jgi:hypothetical protein